MEPTRTYPPSYFPEPIEVPNHAAQGPYLPRVRFVRSVVALHALTIVATVGVAIWGSVPVWPWSLGIFLGSLVAMSAERRVFGNSALAQMLSPTLLVIGLYGLAGMVAPIQAWGIPLEGIALVSVATLVYVSLCGKAFSYLGLGFLSFVPSFVGLLFLGRDREGGWVASAAVISAIWTFYVCYDLSMVVKRRRTDEVGPAVADLYRDLLNFALYPGRVWLHWKRYRFL